VSFPSLVGSKEYADVVFHIGNHALYAHRSIIESRCPPLFSVAIKDRGKKGHLQTLKSDEKLVDIRSLTLVLEYLYTGSVPFSEITPAEVISLIAHTELYQIDRLRWLCERYLQAALNHDLFFTLLLLSDVSGVARAKRLCMIYGALHFEALITKKDQVHTLGIELFREFVVHATSNHEVVEDLNQLSFPNTIREEFKIIFTAMAHPDAFFTFKTANTTVPCHKAILFAQSDRFKTLFLEDGPSAADNRYSLPKNISMPHEAFRSFLAWAYYRDASFSAEHAAMMLPLAHDFGIDSLVQECSGKLRKGISTTSVLPILTLCFSEWGKKGYKSELAQPCLDFLIFNFARVDLTDLKSAAIAAAIAEAVRDAVTTGLWSPITSSQNASNNAESSSAPSNFEPLEEPHVDDATNSRTEDTPREIEDKKTSRRNKRRTVDLSDSAFDSSSAVAVAAPTPAPATEEASTSSPSSPVVSARKSARKVQAEANATESNDVKGETEEKEQTKETVQESSSSAPVTEDSTKSVAPTETHVETSNGNTASSPKEATKEPEVVEEKKTATAPATTAETTHDNETQTASESIPEQDAPKTKVPKTSSSGDVKTKAVETKPEESKAPTKSDSRAKVESSASGTPSASPSTSKRAKVSSTEPAAAAAAAASSKKSGKSDEPSEVPVSPSTKEKRATLEPSTSVKAIKESFEAKGREETEKDSVADKLRAGRRKGAAADDKSDLKSSSESTKKDSKTKK
jgi:hypothetical protein